VDGSLHQAQGLDDDVLRDRHGRQRRRASVVDDQNGATVSMTVAPKERRER
jgi:hypothetical protein